MRIVLVVLYLLVVFLVFCILVYKWGVGRGDGITFYKDDE